MGLKTKRICSMIMAVLVIVLTIPANVVSAITLSGVWNGSIASAFAYGMGTEGMPYIIETASQLAYFAQSVNSGNKYMGMYIKLANDIELNYTNNWENWETVPPSNTWTPIGNSRNSFLGTFDGDGYTVSGIYINTTGDYLGLFGYVENDGIIKNIGIIKSYIKGNNYIGGVAGYAYSSDGAIGNCYNTGKIQGNSEVGGIVGQATNSAVSNCYNTGEILGTGNNVGGIAGTIDGTGILANCYNTGSVSGITYIGGVTGYCTRIIVNSYNVGIVNGTEDKFGGISGYAWSNSTIASCYYLDNTAPKGIGEGTGQAIALTDEQIKKQTSFENWDFEYEWFMEEDYRGFNTCPQGYPKLQAFGDFSSIPSCAVWDGSYDTTWSGYGTKAYPYMITSAEELRGLALMVSDGRSYTNVYFKLMTDIVLNNYASSPYWHHGAKQWMPIGNSQNKFNGIFDGNEHTVSGVYINTLSSNQGLFGCLLDGQIINLSIKDSYIKGSINVGGIAGEINRTTINNCNNAGTIRGIAYLGGIAGDSTVSIINGNNTGEINGIYNTGGILGNASGSIYDCHNTGRVSGIWDTGGVVGEATNVTTVFKSSNTASINGISGTGGIAGYLAGNAKYCFNTGIINGAGSKAGGIVGNNYNSTIYNCYNTGTVYGSNFVGGVAGFCESSTIGNCYNTGVTAGEDGYYIGGIGGYIPEGCIVKDCYYLADTASAGIGSGTGETIAVTDEQMKDKSVFVNWDFKYDWFMEEVYRGDNACPQGYPKIQAFGDFSAIPSSAVWNGETDTIWAGSGTEDNPYLITSAEELAGLAKMVNGGTDYSKVYFELTTDIMLNNYEAFSYWQNSANQWVPIGNSSHNNFKGTFNGNGHTVSGIYINTVNENQGLFGYVYSGNIEGIGVKDSYLTGKNTIGGVVGYAYQSIISNCFNTGRVEGYDCVGGVAGYINISTLSNCYNTGTVTGKSEVGGVAGHLYGNISIINSYNTGAISGSMYIGGIAGYVSYSSVINSYNTGVISGSKIIGGIAGYVSFNSSVINSYNTGAISGSMYIGSIAGDVYGITVTNCYYLIGTATTGIGSGTGETAARTYKQMTNQNNFIDWDFNNIWVTGCSEDYDFPTLRGLTHVFPTHEHISSSEKFYDDIYHCYICIDCNKKVEITEHSYDGICDSACNICGFTRTVHHSFGEWTVTIIPKETSSGQLTRTCKNDGSHTETFILPELNKADYIYIELMAPECETAGMGRYVYSKDDQTFSFDITLPSLGHDYSEWVVTINPTESTEGELTRICGHDNTHTDSLTLPILNETDYYYDVVTDPTCETDGLGRYTYTIDNKSFDFDVTLPAIGHSYGKWSVTTSPTTTTTGTLIRVCDNDSTHTDTFTLPVLSTTNGYAYTVVAENSCTEDGTGRFTYIKDNQTFPFDITLPANGHSYGEWEAVTEPTESNEGLRKRTCSVCDHVDSDIIPALSTENGYTYSVITQPSTSAEGQSKWEHDDYGTFYTVIPILPITTLDEVLSTSLSFKDGFVQGFETGTTIGDYFSGDFNIAVFDTKDNNVTNKRLATGYVILLFDKEGSVLDSATVVIMGDVNGDGNITALDYINIRLSILGLSDLSSAQLKSADVNNDGNIKALDYINLRLYLLGLAGINQ